MEGKLFIGSLKPTGAFMSYVMGTMTAPCDEANDMIVLKDIIRVSEVPMQNEKGMSVQLAIMTDVYFSVESETKVTLSEFFMTRIADEEKDRKIIDQYNNEVLKLRTQRSGLVTPKGIKGIV